MPVLRGWMEETVQSSTRPMLIAGAGRITVFLRENVEMLNPVPVIAYDFKWLHGANLAFSAVVIGIRSSKTMTSGALRNFSNT